MRELSFKGDCQPERLRETIVEALTDEDLRKRAVSAERSGEHRSPRRERGGSRCERPRPVSIDER